MSETCFPSEDAADMMLRYAEHEIAFAAIKADAVKAGIVGRKAVAAFEKTIYVAAQDQQGCPIYALGKNAHGDIIAIRQDILLPTWAAKLKAWMRV
jgi:hypothetical protein